MLLAISTHYTEDLEATPLLHAAQLSRRLLHHIESPSSSNGLGTETAVILQAFAWPVWYSLFAILVLISFLLHIVLRREEAVVHAGSEAPQWETSEVLIATIGAICQQGSHRHPDTAAARTIFICLFCLSVIIYTAYSAAFVALLSPPVHRHQHNIMSTSNHRRFMMKNVSIESMASSILKSNIITCTTKQEPLDPDLSCNLLNQNEIGDKVLITLGQASMRENLEVCNDNEVTFMKDGKAEIISLRMEDAFPAFIILGSGIIAALILLVIEIVKHRQNVNDKFKMSLVSNAEKLPALHGKALIL
ncbi:uncharacterized protein [Hetaerina americana]|uniref:uncharacterized protein n=1 Tax=Hetaerina americana TaxID=62018 RepID=UPI003A7F4B0F